MKNESSPEVQEALKTMETADKLNNTFVAKGANGVKQLVSRWATSQFPNKTLEEFYRDLANTPLLEPQVRAILLNKVKEMRRSQEHALAQIQERKVGAQIKEALSKPRPSPVIDEEVFAEGPLPGQDPFTEDFGDGRSRRLPIEVE